MENKRNLNKESIRYERKIVSRKKIIESAIELFKENGISSTKIEDIISRSGISRATFYVHFKSKNDVGRAIVTDMWNKTTEMYANFARLPDWSEESIRGWLTDVNEAWVEDRDGASVLYREMLDEISMGVQNHEEQFAQALIGDGKRWNSFSPEEAWCRALLLIFQLERTMVSVYFGGWNIDRKLLIDTLTNIWITNLK